jgi:hypothetical protein
LKPGAPGLNADLAMQQAVAMIRSNPFPLLLGLRSFVLRFLQNQSLYINAYVWVCCSGYMQWYRIPFVVLEVIGLIYALRPRRTRIEGLCLSAFVGCVLSSAFTFWHVDTYRTFAATAALEALLVGLGAWAICRGFGLQSTAGHDFQSSTKAVCVISASIVMLSLFTPLFAGIARLQSRSRAPVSWRAKGMTPVMIDLGQSSPYLRILPPGSKGIVPNVAEDKFLHDRTFNGVGIARKLATLRSGDLLVLAHDLSGLNDSTEASEYYPLWLIIPGATGLVTPTRYQICVTRDDIPTDFGPQPFLTSQKVEPAKQP